MTIDEAIKVLKLHNKWRRGAEIEMQTPKQIGIAIDVVISQINRNAHIEKIELGDRVYYDSTPMQDIPCEVIGIRGRKGVVQYVEIEGEFVGERGVTQSMWVQVEKLILTLVKH